MRGTERRKSGHGMKRLEKGTEEGKGRRRRREQKEKKTGK